MKSKFLFFLFLFIFSILSTSAYQEKMTVKECFFSFNEVPVDGVVPFAPWNEETQTGVFLKINNSNLALGDTESPSYEYTSYQNGGSPRDYYNNFGYVASKTSSIPILTVTEGKPNKVYIKCNYVVGNHRVYFLNFIQTYFGESRLRLTTDFNITQGYVDSSSDSSYHTFSGNYYSYFNSFYSKTDSIYFFDNENVQSSSSSVLLSDGFYPFTDPYVITYFDLSSVPPGIIDAISLVRENGYRQLFDAFRTFIYVNSSHLNEPILFPDLKNSSIEVYDPEGHLISEYYRYCYLGKNQCPALENGSTIKFNVTYQNPFGFNIENLRLRLSYGPTYMWVGGMGHVSKDASDEIPMYNKMGSYVENINDISFSANEEKTFSWEYKIEDTYALPDTLFSPRFYKGGSYSKPIYDRIGGDCVDYLGFNRIDPYISLTKIGEEYVPIFKFVSQLYLFNNRVNSTFCNNSVEPGEYSFLVQLVDESGEIRDQFILPFDEDSFEELGFDCSTSCNLTPNAHDDDYVYSINIPITEEYANMVQEGEDFTTLVYTLRNEPPFNNSVIARNGVLPSFKPGNVAYLFDNVLDFYDIKRRDVGEVLLFNPSRYPITINLSLESLEDSRFKTEFVDNVYLYPFETRKVLVDVVAMHTKWPTEPNSSSMRIKAVSVLNDNGELTTQEEFLDFSLFMNSVNSPYLDIVPEYIDPSFLGFSEEGEVDNREIGLSWSIVGSEDQFDLVDDENYTVNFSLYDTEDNLLLNDSATFFIDKFRKYYSFSFNYDFNSSVDYKVVVFLDSDSFIGEIDEDNNMYVLNLPTTIDRCYYNSSENQQYFLDFFGDLVLDADCDYHCCPDDTRCRNGFCSDQNSYECSSYGTATSCNDFDITSPYLCAFSTEGCIPCGTLIKSCGAYDNSESCTKDSCDFNRNDELITGLSGHCEWDGDSCVFNGDLCVYEITEIGDCETEHYLDYVSSDSDCENKQVHISCPYIIRVDFFNWLNFILVGLLLVIFYIIYYNSKNP